MSNRKTLLAGVFYIRRAGPVRPYVGLNTMFGQLMDLLFKFTNSTGLHKQTNQTANTPVLQLEHRQIVKAIQIIIN